MDVTLLLMRMFFMSVNLMNKLIHRIQLSDETSSHWSVNSEYG